MNFITSTGRVIVVYIYTGMYNQSLLDGRISIVKQTDVIITGM